jgi:hypothetical protein
VSTSPGSEQGNAALRDEKLDALTGDVILSSTDSDQQMVYGADGIASDLKAAWGEVQGEWFLNLGEGVDYYGLVFVKNPNLNAIRQEFIRVAMTVTGVVQVRSFDPQVDTATRSMSASYEVECDTGLVIQEENQVLLSLGSA